MSDRRLEEMSRSELLRELEKLEAASRRLAESAGEEDRERLLHDLYVHQVELEMQNRELRDSQDQLQAATSRYADLYDFAPVGYMTLTPDGEIREINLTGARLLGWPRERLVGSSFRAVAVLAAPHRFQDLLGRLARDKVGVTGEVTLLRGRRGRYELQVIGSPVLDADRRLVAIRMILVDVSDQKQLESRLRLLATAGESLGASLDARTALDTLASIAVPALADLCLIDLLGEGDVLERLVVRFADADKQAALGEQLMTLRPEAGRTTAQGRVIETDEPMLLAEVPATMPAEPPASAGPRSRQDKALRAAGIRSLMVLPLRARGQALGAVTLATAESDRRFSTDDLRLAQELVGRAALALDNAQLYAERASELDALQRLQQVGSLYLRDHAADSVLRAVLEAAIAVSGADFGNIQIMNPETGGLVVVAHRGLPDWWIEYWNRTPRGSGACGTALARGERVLVEDVLDSPIFTAETREIQRRAGIRAVQSTPLVGRDGTPLGMISTHYRTPHRPSEGVLRLLDLLARQAAELIERARADAALRAATERYRTLFESIDQGFCVMEVVFDDADRAIDLRFLQANPAFERHTGIANPVGRLVRELLPALEEHWLQLYGRIARTGVAEHHAGWAAPLARFYEVYAFRLGSREERQVAALFTDATARKRAEEHRQILADIGPTLAGTLDLEETLTRVADVAARYLSDFCLVDLVDEAGALRRLRCSTRDPANEAVRRRLQEVPLDPARPYLTRQALELREPVLVERLSPMDLESLTQSEEHREALRATGLHSLMVVPLMARDRPLGAIAFLSSTRFYDQSDFALAQEIARRAALAMENAILFRATDRAVHARDEVLGIVAHDLRNPLHAIVLHAALLRAPAAGPEQPSPEVDGIERSARRMERLIQDLLEVTRIEAGALRLDRTRFPAVHLLADFAAGEQSLSDSSSVELELEVEAGGELGEVSADRDRLHQVLENLVGNARRFTSQGGRITVGARSMEREVWFSVADTGAGIAPEDIPHLFERFWQGKRRGRRGAGLGLPIVKGIVEAHGGRVWVDSQVGVGSTFYFSLPLAGPESKEASAAAPTPAAEKSAARGLRAGGSPTPGDIVLVAEDDPDERDVLRVALELAGYRVATVSNGAEALAYLHHQAPPVLIILDLAMPILDGWEFLRARDRDPSLSAIPVIVVSGQRDVADRIAAAHARYLPKPVKMDHLLEAMTQA